MHKAGTLVYCSWVLVLACSLLVVMAGPARECEDRAHWCDKIGNSLPLSRCYKHQRRCCRTCSRLQLPIAGCPYGDKQSWCSTVGVNRPPADCYAYNDTCCQTCHLYDSGIPDCPFGDRVTWCSAIGLRYSVSSCYDHNYLCCRTCNQFDTGISACPYGDRLAWCSGIGSVFPHSLCSTNEFVCCATCRRLLLANGTATNITDNGDDRRHSGDDRRWPSEFITLLVSTTHYPTRAITTVGPGVNTTHAYRNASSTRSTSVTSPMPHIRHRGHRGHRGQSNRTKTTIVVPVVHSDPEVSSLLPLSTDIAREQFVNGTLDGRFAFINGTAETTVSSFNRYEHDSRNNITQVHREVKGGMNSTLVKSSAPVATSSDQRRHCLVIVVLFMLLSCQ